jgi:hypothetical protein
MAREAPVKNRTAAKNGAKTLALVILKLHNVEQLGQIKRQVKTWSKHEAAERAGWSSPGVKTVEDRISIV